MTQPDLPQGYEPHELPADYTGPLFIEGQMRAHGVACAKEALLEAAEKLNRLIGGDGIWQHEVEDEVRRMAEEI